MGVLKEQLSLPPSTPTTGHHTAQCSLLIDGLNKYRGQRGLPYLAFMSIHLRCKRRVNNRVIREINYSSNFMRILLNIRIV